MKLFYPDTPDLPLPDDHRFRRGKHRLLRERLQHDARFRDVALAPAPIATLADIRRAHTDAYVTAVLEGGLRPTEQRRIGLPWSEILAVRALSVVGGALAAARLALEEGLSGQLAGGTHHAHADFGSGFCVFNDLAVTALTLLAEGAVQRIAIIDLDVHQGDGNAAILTTHPDVMVLSVHGERNFPFQKMTSDIDIGLPDGTDDDGYLAVLPAALDQIAAFRPDLILYLSGADPLASDTLGRLALSLDGLAARDRLVFQLARRQRVPISIAIGGGYGDPISDSVAGYAQTFAVARDVMAR